MWSRVSVTFYLPNEILVFDHAEVPANSLGDPLPCHQISHQDGRRANTNYKRKECERHRAREGKRVGKERDAEENEENKEMRNFP